jgi:hypothetical protein
MPAPFVRVNQQCAAEAAIGRVIYFISKQQLQG